MLSIKKNSRATYSCSALSFFDCQVVTFAYWWAAAYTKSVLILDTMWVFEQLCWRHRWRRVHNPVTFYGWASSYFFRAYGTRSLLEWWTSFVLNDALSMWDDLYTKAFIASVAEYAIQSIPSYLLQSSQNVFDECVSKLRKQICE